jgi:RNA polymerase sigma-70 factor (ECF subfamily)
MTDSSVRELRALLVPFISKRVQPQDVDDVVQTVFVRIQRGVAELRDSDKLIAWGYQIARNAIIDHARHTSVRQHERVEDLASVAAVDELDEESELAPVVGHFIGMLAAPYREALQLTELDGLTQAEAARRVGLSIPGMKSRVQRARAQLRGLLETCCDIELDARGTIIDVEPRNRPADLPNCCDVHPSRTTPVSRDMTNTRQNTQNDETTTNASSCCGGPAPADSGACCVKDAAAKAAGESGCGCGAKTQASAPTAAKRCC